MRFAAPPSLNVVATAVAIQNGPLPPTEPPPLSRWATPDGQYPQDDAPQGEEAVGPDLSELVIDAICGVGFPTLASGIEAEQIGLAVPTGNRDRGPYWVWVREALKKLPERRLQNIYVNLKIAQHAG